MDSDNNADRAIPEDAPAAVSVDPVIPDAAPSSSNIGSTVQEYASQRSKVNGIGMWSAWERNFSNKLKACLDLVDNAVDAALWDSDDEEDDEDENRGRPLTVRERWEKQSGNIHISTEKHRLAMEHYDSDDDDDNDDEGNVGVNDAASKPAPILVHDVIGGLRGQAKTGTGDLDASENTGDFRLIDEENTLCLHNDCVKPVKELRKILDVYNSDKTASAIGENGVGVKQAAAAMSDLSIVVTTRIDEEPLLMDYGDLERSDNSVKRIRKVLVSVGVLSKTMQTPDACMIPSWTLPIEFDIDEQHEKKDGGPNDEVTLNDDFDGNSCTSVLMRKLFMIMDNSYLFSQTMKKFGGAAAKNRRMYGMRRLAKHIELMVMSSKKKNKEVKPPHPHQYLMILHKFGKHKYHDENGRSEAERNVSIEKARNDLDDLLRDLADEMPKTYIHIPPAPYFKVRVNQKLLKFQYYERNLVELHQIPLVIDRKNDFRTAEDWLDPQSTNDTYEIKVSIGFDPTRANPLGSHLAPGERSDFIGGQACSLLIFSRISGRLFLKHDDARGVLRLLNSGTSFCQGLTIIVDDYEGHLPLTPTKESLAFGMEDCGKIHERNLYAWLGALASLYWNHFQGIFKKKRDLGLAIQKQLDCVKMLREKKGSDLPTLRFGNFSTVKHVCFSRERLKESIRHYKSDHTIWTVGPHTLVSLYKAAEKRKPKAAKKRKASDSLELDDQVSDGNDQMNDAPSSSDAEKGHSEQAPGEPNVENLPERSDGRPRRAMRQPKRFTEIHKAPKIQKKRLKSNSNDVQNVEVQLKKRLKEMESLLFETQIELNASKATCDDLQLQLDEMEEQLNESEARHRAELQRLEEDFIKRQGFQLKDK